MRYKNGIADNAAFNLYGIADDAVIADAGFSAQIRIGTDAAIFADADVPLDDGAGFDDGAFAQLKNAVDDGKRVDGAMADRLQLQQFFCRFLQAHPWGIVHIISGWR